MREHFLLGEVSKVLGRQPHHVAHVLTTGKVPEPAAEDWEQAIIHTRRCAVPGSAFRRRPQLASPRTSV